MTPPVPLPVPPPAVRRPAPVSRPFALIFDALPNHAPDVVQSAIDSLATHRKRIDIPSVMEIVGRVPLPPAPEPMTPEPRVGEEAEVQRLHLERVAAQIAPRPDRLAAKLARCHGRPALTEAQEARYQAIVAKWNDYGYLPASNRYQAGCGAQA